ncbi:tetratricopeptide repeat domain-containing protein [Hirsutella rhossiliensis]|uniref:Tetratricopeptide repeat domain-containing protein n=1 Tax=Hirsutella rhossiliensis TaxID=111463 RepID=A0A9P8N5T9_9HYPO|nr:tetratricopeptide repeat domain-containing protein [Hirsutella rhossiliensis]KAH0966506.1 tetratricopeptide repeat domain-containing protein [Hirsutella rhossiliensis]
MGSVNVEISRFEITGVYTHPEAQVDIVLVHGLNGDPKKSWTAKSGIFWPTQLLPESLRDKHANVLVYGYNADVYSRSNDRSSDGTFRNPIIWVAHSLGGILVKRALLYSSNVLATSHEDLRSIYISTHAAIFLGTPHTGSGLASWGRVLQAMSDVVVPRKLFESEPILLKTLKRDSEQLQEINNRFLDIHQRFKILMAHENRKTSLGLTRALVVNATSASPQLPGVIYYGIEATHSTICKFENENTPGYRTISTTIRDWVAEAPPVIEVRWKLEDEDRWAQAQREIDERRMPFTLSQAQINIHGLLQSLQTIDKSINAFNAQPRFATLPDKFFGVPYPKNRWFTGREAILSNIQDVLTNLAIEFGYRQKQTFTHVFWISSDSEDKLDQGLCNLARSLGLASDTVVEDKEKIVNTAMTWLKTADLSSNWLLILDNVDDARILNPLWSDLHRGSVLITSRDPIPGLTAVTSRCSSSRLVQLSPHEGAVFVKWRLQEKIQGEIDDKSAADLAKRFGYYPLYMDQMMSFIESAPLTLDEFYKQLESEPADDELQDLCIDSPWYTTSVAKAIESHMTKLRSFDSQARDILTTVAFFDPDSIPERLLLSTDGQVSCLSSTVKQHKILLTLSQPSFIYHNSGSPSQERCISLHRLVRDAALRSDLAPQKAFETAVRLLRKSFPLQKLSRDHMVEDWAECEIFQPHVLSLHHRYLDFRDRGVVAPSFDFLELIYSCAWYLCERGRFHLSKALISSIHQDYERLTKLGRVAPAEFLADIYTVQLYYHNETDHQVSLVELATRAMNIRENAVEQSLMDEHHPNRANGFMNMGVVLALEDPKAAIGMHSRALEIRRGSDKYKTEQIHGFALNYLNIGRCWWVVGELEKAASCFEQCLVLWKGREAQVGKKFSLTAWALLALGIVRADQNDLENATKLMSESLALHIYTMGERHMKTLVCYYRLGWLCQRIGEHHRAEQLLTICHDIYSTLPRPPKPELARTKFQLSTVLKKIGAPKECYLTLDRESRQLLSEIVLCKGGRHVDKEVLNEADFDNQVDYYYR